MINVFGMTDIARLLGISASKVKYLWNGRVDKAGHAIAPQLNYRVTPTGKRYSTRADINAYLKRTYNTQLS